MDLSGISTADLQNYQAGNLSAVSTQGLVALHQLHSEAAPAPKAAPAAASAPANAIGDDAGESAAFGEALANSVPGGQKISSAIGATIAKAASPITGDERTFGQLYNQANADTEATATANPKSAIAGTAAGIVSSLPLFTAAGKAAGAAADVVPGVKTASAYLSGLGKSAKDAGVLERVANLGIRSAKGAAMAAPVGALYGAANDTTGDAGAGALSGAGQAAEIGAALPVVGAGLAGVGNVLGAAKRFISGIGRKAGEEIQATPPPPSPAETNFSDITGKPLADQKGALTGKLPLSPGVQAKDPNLLRIEENARQGNLGQEAQGKMQEYDANVMQGAKDAMQQLKGVTNNDSDTSLANAVKTFQDHANIVKTNAQNLYKQRDAMMADAVLNKSKVGGSLGYKLGDVVTDPSNVAGFKSKAGAPAQALMQDYRDLINGTQGKELPFSDLAAWRQDVAHLATTDQSVAGNMAGKLGRAYDNWMDSITQDHFLSGDPAIAVKAKEASAAWKSYKSLFGSENSPVIEGMVKPYDATPADFVNKVFGATVKGTQNTALNMRKMTAALPPEAQQQFKDNVFSGLVSKAFEGANKGDNLSLANLRNNLSTLQNSQVFKETWANDPDKAPVIKNLVDDLTQHITQTGRRDVYSPSGGAVMRGINALVGVPAKIPLVNMVPGVKGIAQLGNLASEQSQNFADRSAFEKAVSGAIKTARSNAKGKSVLDFDGIKSAVFSGAMGGSNNNGEENE